jgi:RNA polymerase sigma-70 factor (ECF subfamily)
VPNPTVDSAEDDAALARRIIAAGPARDAAAEALLYASLAPRVRLYGRKHLRDAQRADDLVQDVLLMTFERLGRGEIREPERIASFVLGACRQTVIDLRRGESRRERLLKTYGTEIVAESDGDAEPADTRQLEHCLERLPERERTVVLMTFYDDSSADVVAKSLDLSAGNVRVIRHRAVERLRRCIEGAGA